MLFSPSPYILPEDIGAAVKSAQNGLQQHQKLNQIKNNINYQPNKIIREEERSFTRNSTNNIDEIVPNYLKKGEPGYELYDPLLKDLKVIK